MIRLLLVLLSVGLIGSLVAASPHEARAAYGPDGCIIDVDCGPGITADDLDGDGVPNAQDECANSYKNEPVDADGCGPFRAEARLHANTTRDMADVPDVGGQCINPKGVPCTFRLTLTLSKASAKKLKLDRKIMDVSIKTQQSAKGGKYLFGKRDTHLKREVTRAFDRAVERSLPVTMTFAGTYARGTGAPEPLPHVTFTMKRKAPGGAFNVEPMISDGDGGPASNGLSVKRSDNS